jgi:curved DNA-binding protein
MEYKDYYQVLGVPRTASQDEIKRAYRKLARKYHPDVSKEADAENKFKELNEAHEVLKDPGNRVKYDQLGQNWNQPHQQQQHARSHGARQPSYEYASGGDVDPAEFEDLINSIFGQGRRPSARRAPTYDQGQDIYAKLTISLEDSYHGAQKTLQLQVPVIHDDGRMEHENRTIKVKIPAGIGDKQQIRLKGQGGKTPGHKPRDLYVEMNIAPHHWYRLQNKDVHLELPITPWEAALGATVNVPTLGGVVKLKIAKLSQSGKQMRLKGRGLPGAPHGDQYVTLHIVIPPKETPESDELYQALANALPFNPREKLGVSND